MIVIKEGNKWKKLTLRIYKAQIILDHLKKAVKIGQKNISKLRDERELLMERTTGFHGSGKVKR